MKPKLTWTCRCVTTCCFNPIKVFNMDEKIFLPVPDIKLNDLLDWTDPEQRKHRHLVHCSTKELKLIKDGNRHLHKKCFGNAVEVNDAVIAIFRIGNDVYATQAHCPHAGGPLYLADIEELIPGQVCLKCPWHKWTFNIDTGCSVTPKGRGLVAMTYPTRVDKDGQIFIGFDSFGPSAFRID